MGLIFDNIENFDQAAVNFHKAIQLKPYFPDALNNLGNIYYKKMDYERSSYYLKRSINQSKKNNMAFHNLANTKRSMGMYKEAIIFYYCIKTSISSAWIYCNTFTKGIIITYF